MMPNAIDGQLERHSTRLQPKLRIELELPHRLSAKTTEQFQRALVHHLLLESEISMYEALTLLPLPEQRWLVETLLHDAQEALFLADTVNEPAWRQRFWSQFKTLLEHLFVWHEQWSEFHNELLSLLHTVTRRYASADLTPERTQLLLRLLQRLHETRLYREDVFSAKRALQEMGLETILDLSPVADQLFASYTNELNRG